jgi:uncharacterized protein
VLPHPGRPAPGDPIVVQWRKWPGQPHWRHESVWLGSDAHGDWVGQPRGARSSRPAVSATRGAVELLTDTANVSLIPASGDWDATLYPPEHPEGTRVYIDLGADIRWSAPGLLTGIDMDLDVVRDARGTWIDDEDEFAEHAAAWDYPPELLRTLPAIAAELVDRVAAATPPFDEATRLHWMAVLESVSTPARGPGGDPPDRS